MAETKKTEPAAKAEVVKRPVAAVAVTEKAPEKKEEVKAEVKTETETKTTKAPAKKAAAKTTAKKAPAKKAVKADTKTAEKAVKAPAKKAAVKQIINFQFAGKSYSMEDLVKIAGDVWKYDLHKNEEAYESLELYVKPEESVAYYVFNGDITGSFFI